jgi:hypothetical protein
MLGHKVVSLGAVAATCVTDGKTEGSMCSRCGEFMKAQTVIAATGHTVVELKAVEPTCTETGKTMGSVCSTCGTVYAEQEEVPKSAHAYENGICKNCGYIDLQAYVDSGNYTERTAATGDKVMGKVFRVYRGTDLSTTSGFNLIQLSPMLYGYPQGTNETQGATTATDGSQDSWDLAKYISNGIQFIVSDGYMDIYFPEGGVIDFIELSFPDQVSYGVIDEETSIGNFFYGKVVELVRN